MPETTAAKFEIKYLQILDETGKCDEKLMPKLSKEQILKMYELMVESRIFDDILFKLQREGRVLTFAPGKGQEAAQVGSVMAMEKDDWIAPAFRENTAFIALGMPMETIIQYWGGDERGNKMPPGINALPVAIPVGGHITHAVGMAWAFKLQKKKSAMVCFFGDGATSKGDFYEGLNMAGVFKVPLVAICQNNHWAISVPVKQQTAAETLAQKAIAFGFEGIKVDGNDVFAMYKATKEALEKAKAGNGPVLIEAYTYRLSDHTTADDAKKYRDPKEVEKWIPKDPIIRLKKYILSNKVSSESELQKIEDSARKKVDEAVKKAELIQPPNPVDMFDYAYDKKPWHVEEETADFKEHLAREGGK